MCKIRREAKFGNNFTVWRNCWISIICNLKPMNVSRWANANLPTHMGMRTRTHTQTWAWMVTLRFTFPRKFCASHKTKCWKHNILVLVQMFHTMSLSHAITPSPSNPCRSDFMSYLSKSVSVNINVATLNVVPELEGLACIPAVTLEDY